MIKWHAVDNMKSKARFSFCHSGSSVICSIEEFKTLPEEEQCKRCKTKLKKLKLI